MNATIKSILDTFGYPAEFQDYDGAADTYFVFNYADDRGANYADDAPQEIQYSIQIHLFCPKSFNFLSLKTQVREALFAAGFSYPTVQSNYESDTKINHVVWECEYVKAREV